MKKSENDKLVKKVTNLRQKDKRSQTNVKSNKLGKEITNI